MPIVVTRREPRHFVGTLLAGRNGSGFCGSWNVAIARRRCCRARRRGRRRSWRRRKLRVAVCHGTVMRRRMQSSVDRDGRESRIDKVLDMTDACPLSGTRCPSTQSSTDQRRCRFSSPDAHRLPAARDAFRPLRTWGSLLIRITAWRAPGTTAKSLARRVTLQPERGVKLVKSQLRYAEVPTSEVLPGPSSRASATASDAWATRPAGAAQACSLRDNSHSVR